MFRQISLKKASQAQCLTWVTPACGKLRQVRGQPGLLTEFQRHVSYRVIPGLARTTQQAKPTREQERGDS